MMKTDLIAPFEKLWEAIRVRTSPVKFYFTLLTALLLGGFGVLLLPGIPAGHDIGFHLCRIAGVSEAFRNGIFPPWINYDAIHQMGYGTGLFYSNLPIYLPAALTACGLPLIWSYKLLLLGSGLAAAWSMFFAAWKIGRGSAFAAFAAALLYTWSSYFATDVFNRAALGEVTAFIFVPWVLLGIYNAVYGKASGFMPLAFGFAGLFYAHSITFVLMSIGTALFFAFTFARLLRDWRRIFWIALAGALAAGLAAFAFLPMFEQLAHLKFNLTGQTMESPVHLSAVPLTRLFLELPYMKLEHWIPPGIGIIFLVVSFQRFRTGAPSNDEERFGDAAMIAGFAFLLSATNFLPWEGMMRSLSSIQFPWRCYLPATAFLALSGGLLAGKIVDKGIGGRFRWSWILIFGCAFPWGFNTAYTYAAKFHEKQIWKSIDSAMIQRYSASGQHYLPQGVRLAELPAAPPPAARGGLRVESIELKRPAYGVLIADLDGVRGSGKLELPLLPYYGYRAESAEDGLNFALDFSNRKLSVVIPSDYDGDDIKISYRNTAMQKLALAVSTLCLLLAGGWALLKKLTKQEKK